MQYTPHKCLIFFSGCYWNSQGGVLKQSGDARGCSFRGKHSVDVDIHVIKQPCIARGVGSMFSSQGQPSLFARNREIIFSNPLPVQGSRWVISCSNHRCSNPIRRREILAAKEGVINPRGGCAAWVRGGENSDYRVGEKATKQLEETISSFFPALFCTGRINFFPTMRVFFHADWSTAGLSQQLDSEEKRTRRIEKREDGAEGVSGGGEQRAGERDRNRLWQRCLSWWSVGSKSKRALRKKGGRGMWVEGWIKNPESLI